MNYVVHQSDFAQLLTHISQKRQISCHKMATWRKEESWGKLL